MRHAPRATRPRPRFAPSTPTPRAPRPQPRLDRAAVTVAERQPVDLERHADGVGLERALGLVGDVPRLAREVRQARAGVRQLEALTGLAGERLQDLAGFGGAPDHRHAGDFLVAGDQPPAETD